MEIKCSNCGSEYWLTEHKLPALNRGGLFSLTRD